MEDLDCGWNGAAHMFYGLLFLWIFNSTSTFIFHYFMYVSLQIQTKILGF